MSQRPDHRTINDFRRRHLSALGGLLGQVPRLCQRTGLVKLGHVALDGTKIQANASKHKAMSHARMKEVEPELAAEVGRWFAEADDIDRREDGRHRDGRGDEMPAWVQSKQERLAKIRAAMAAIEAEAAAEAAAVKRTGGQPRRPGRATRRVQSRLCRGLATWLMGHLPTRLSATSPIRRAS